MPHHRPRPTSPRGVPDDVSRRMYDVLALTAQRLFPDGTDVSTLVKAHTWYDALYLGVVDNKVARWQGWSLSCRKLANGYRTLYFDYVRNLLPKSECDRLFGTSFCEEINGTDEFLYLFVTTCPLSSRSIFEAGGFTIQEFSSTIHPGKLFSREALMSTSELECSDYGLQLLSLQAFVRKNRSTNK